LRVYNIYMTGSGINRNWTGKKILIAEDIHVNYILLEAILKRTNVNLIWAKNGKEAVEICMNNDDIDLVLMDINMPVMNGLEATAEIRKHKKDLPVIAQTAYELDFGKEDFEKAGLTHVLAKPLMPEITIAAIGEFLGINGES